MDWLDKKPKTGPEVDAILARNRARVARGERLKPGEGVTAREYQAWQDWRDKQSLPAGWPTVEDINELLAKKPDSRFKTRMDQAKRRADAKRLQDNNGVTKCDWASAPNGR